MSKAIRKLPQTFELARVQTFVLRVPIENPVRTSFGVMHDRPAVVVCLEDRDGFQGWGEVWCNFPACGAEHRGLLIDTVCAPALVGQRFSFPSEASELLLKSTHVLRLQTREFGPLDQVIAGIDIALWDLHGRRCDTPVWKLLGDTPMQSVPVYASGINPERAVETVRRCRNDGHKAFKVKIGFNQELDRQIVETLGQDLNETEHLMADANQAWSLDEALNRLSIPDWSFLDWLEEPMPVDVPIDDWRKLASASNIPLAGGENISSCSAFAQFMSDGLLAVLQPDVCKWGGISKIMPIARSALSAGRRYCPHYLGGGLGLVASAHCLAASGGDGMLELDVNPNPLRSLLAQPFPSVIDGMLELPSDTGLGVRPDLNAIEPYIVLHRTSE